MLSNYLMITVRNNSGKWPKTTWYITTRAFSGDEVAITKSCYNFILMLQFRLRTFVRNCGFNKLGTFSGDRFPAVFGDQIPLRLFSGNHAPHENNA